MLYAGVDWPDGWAPGDVGTLLYVMRHVGHQRAFRVRVPFASDLREGTRADTWIAEYLTRFNAWPVAASSDPLVACGLCLLYDTTEADAEAFW